MTKYFVYANGRPSQYVWARSQLEARGIYFQQHSPTGAVYILVEER